MLLRDLPPELLSMILEAVDSPPNLHHLIAALCACYRVFALSPERCLSSTLRNAILPAARRYAIALLHIPSPLPGARVPEATAIKEFLAEHLDDHNIVFPKDRASLVALSRRHFRIIRFLEHYAGRSLQGLETSNIPNRSFPWWASDHVDLGSHWNLEQNSVCSRLSFTERSRFQRAFYLHELYCKAFPIDPDSRDGDTILPSAAQYSHFLRRLHVREGEEMTCVHQYFVSLTCGITDDIEEQFVQAVHAAPGLKHPTVRARSSSRDSRKRRRLALPSSAGFMEDATVSLCRSPPAFNLPSGDPSTASRENGTNSEVDMRGFSYMELIGLDLYSNDGRHEAFENASFLSSLGLDFVYDLLIANDEQRRETIRANNPAQRAFLREAIEHHPQFGFRNTTSQEEDASQSPLGWSMLRNINGSCYRTYLRDPANPLHDKAYIFWDAWRLQDPAIKARLYANQNMGPEDLRAIYSLRRGRSAEERLRGYKVPLSEMKRIVHLFESTYNPWGMSSYESSDDT